MRLFVFAGLSQGLVGGTFLDSVWDGLKETEANDTANQSYAEIAGP